MWMIFTDDITDDTRRFFIGFIPIIAQAHAWQITRADARVLNHREHQVRARPTMTLMA